MNEPTTTAVVIVAWKNTDALDECLAGLVDQSNPPSEFVVADNDADLGDRIDAWTDRLAVRHVAMGSNRGPSAARNAGVAATESALLLFLDDDAVPQSGWVAAYVDLFADPVIAAARGRVEPKRGHLLNELARAYDLGPDVRPSVINTEGNCAMRRAVFEGIGGFNEDMYGHEGAEISTRIMAEHGDDSVVYTPDAVISHDYADGFVDYVTKRFRHGTMLRHLEVGATRRAAARSVRRSRWTWRRVLSLPVKLIGVGAELLGWVWSYLGRAPRSSPAVRS